MKYFRIYSDSRGESHIDEVEVEQNILNLPPPIPNTKISQSYPASSYFFATFPANWDRGWHVAPTKQFAVQISGIFEAESSDGKIIQLGPGSICFTEDTAGKGHRSRARRG